MHANCRTIALTLALFANTVLLAQQPTSRPAANGNAASQPTSKLSDPVEIARRFVGQLKSGEFDAAVQSFDSTMREHLTVDKLGDVWKGLRRSAGDFQAVGDPIVRKAGELTVVVLPGTWKRAKFDIQVTVNGDGSIGGLFFRPAVRGEAWQRPAYADPALFSEVPITIGVEPYKLEGKLCIPRSIGPHPAVVLVHGSGPHDMDESIGPNKPFRDLAWGLASRGVAVLRYNKRTYSHGDKVMAEGPTASNEVIVDALLALKRLRDHAEVDPNATFIIGHSLGGCLAPVIARADVDLAGFVSLSGTLRELDVVVLEQLEHLASLPGDDQEAVKKQLAQVRTEVEAMRSGSKKAEDKIMNAPVSYWRDINAQLGETGGRALRDFKGRVLILGGGRDYQVTRVDFDKWRSAAGDRKSTIFRWLPDMDHLYIAGTAPAVPADYEKPGHVDASVIEALARWIKTGAWPEPTTQP